MTINQRWITSWAVVTAITCAAGPALAQSGTPTPTPTPTPMPVPTPQPTPAQPASAPQATSLDPTATPPPTTDLATDPVPTTVNVVPLPQAAAGLAPSLTEPPTRMWYQGNAGQRRLAHLSVFGLTGIGYVVSETVLKPVWAAKECTWCNPPGIDTSVRAALKWKDTKLAARLADLDGYVMAPLFGLGAIWLSSVDDHGKDTRVARWLDDSIPIIEALTFAQLVVQAFKFTAARQRPFVHFADAGRAHETDDNMSFISGHSALAFSVATSAGIVAHRRGYQLEPVIWAVGFTLAGSTAYLRIAADKHYFTDVLAGSVVGTAFGVAVPLLLHNDVLRRHQLNLAPTGNGMVLSGAF